MDMYHQILSWRCNFVGSFYISEMGLLLGSLQMKLIWQSMHHFMEQDFSALKRVNEDGS